MNSNSGTPVKRASTLSMGDATPPSFRRESEINRSLEPLALRRSPPLTQTVYASSSHIPSSSPTFRSPLAESSAKRRRQEDALYDPDIRSAYHPSPIYLKVPHSTESTPPPKQQRPSVSPPASPSPRKAPKADTSSLTQEALQLRERESSTVKESLSTSPLEMSVESQRKTEALLSIPASSSASQPPTPAERFVSPEMADPPRDDGAAAGSTSIQPASRTRSRHSSGSSTEEKVGEREDSEDSVSSELLRSSMQSSKAKVQRLDDNIHSLLGTQPGSDKSNKDGNDTEPNDSKTATVELYDLDDKSSEKSVVEEAQQEQDHPADTRSNDPVGTENDVDTNYLLQNVSNVESHSSEDVPSADHLSDRQEEPAETQEEATKVFSEVGESTDPTMETVPNDTLPDTSVLPTSAAGLQSVLSATEESTAPPMFSVMEESESSEEPHDHTAVSDDPSDFIARNLDDHPSHEREESEEMVEEWGDASSEPSPYHSVEQSPPPPVQPEVFQRSQATHRGTPGKLPVHPSTSTSSGDGEPLYVETVEEPHDLSSDNDDGQFLAAYHSPPESIYNVEEEVPVMTEKETTAPSSGQPSIGTYDYGDYLEWIRSPSEGDAPAEEEVYSAQDALRDVRSREPRQNREEPFAGILDVISSGSSIDSREPAQELAEAIPPFPFIEDKLEATVYVMARSEEPSTDEEGETANKDVTHPPLFANDSAEPQDNNNDAPPAMEDVESIQSYQKSKEPSTDKEEERPSDHDAPVTEESAQGGENAPTSPDSEKAFEEVESIQSYRKSKEPSTDKEEEKVNEDVIHPPLPANDSAEPQDHNDTPPVVEEEGSDNALEDETPVMEDVESIQSYQKSKEPSTDKEDEKDSHAPAAQEPPQEEEDASPDNENVLGDVESIPSYQKSKEPSTDKEDDSTSVHHAPTTNEPSQEKSPEATVMEDVESIQSYQKSKDPSTDKEDGKPDTRDAVLLPNDSAEPQAVDDPTDAVQPSSEEDAPPFQVVDVEEEEEVSPEEVIAEEVESIPSGQKEHSSDKEEVGKHDDVPNEELPLHSEESPPPESVGKQESIQSYLTGADTPREREVEEERTYEFTATQFTVNELLKVERINSLPLHAEDTEVPHVVNMEEEFQLGSETFGDLDGRAGASSTSGVPAAVNEAKSVPHSVEEEDFVINVSGGDFSSDRGVAGPRGLAVMGSEEVESEKAASSSSSEFEAKTPSSAMQSVSRKREGDMKSPPENVGHTAAPDRRREANPPADSPDSSINSPHLQPSPSTDRPAEQFPSEESVVIPCDLPDSPAEKEEEVVHQLPRVEPADAGEDEEDTFVISAITNVTPSTTILKERDPLPVRGPLAAPDRSPSHDREEVAPSDVASSIAYEEEVEEDPMTPRFSSGTMELLRLFYQKQNAALMQELLDVENEARRVLLEDFVQERRQLTIDEAVARGMIPHRNVSRSTNDSSRSSTSSSRPYNRSVHPHEAARRVMEGSQASSIGIATAVSGLAAQEVLNRRFIEELEQEDVSIIVRLLKCEQEALHPTLLYKQEQLSRELLMDEAVKDRKERTRLDELNGVHQEIMILRNLVTESVEWTKLEKERRNTIIMREAERRKDLFRLFCVGQAVLLRREEALRYSNAMGYDDALDDLLEKEKHSREALMLSEIGSRPHLHAAATTGPTSPSHPYHLSTDSSGPIVFEWAPTSNSDTTATSLTQKSATKMKNLSSPSVQRPSDSALTSSGPQKTSTKETTPSFQFSSSGNNRSPTRVVGGNDTAVILHALQQTEERLRREVKEHNTRLKGHHKEAPTTSAGKKTAAPKGKPVTSPHSPSSPITRHTFPCSLRGSRSFKDLYNKYISSPDGSPLSPRRQTSPPHSNSPRERHSPKRPYEDRDVFFDAYYTTDVNDSTADGIELFPEEEEGEVWSTQAVASPVARQTPQVPAEEDDEEDDSLFEEDEYTQSPHKYCCNDSVESSEEAEVPPCVRPAVVEVVTDYPYDITVSPLTNDGSARKKKQQEPEEEEEECFFDSQFTSPVRSEERRRGRSQKRYQDPTTASLAHQRCPARQPTPTRQSTVRRSRGMMALKGSNGRPEGVLLTRMPLEKGPGVWSGAPAARNPYGVGRLPPEESECHMLATASRHQSRPTSPEQLEEDWRRGKVGRLPSSLRRAVSPPSHTTFPLVAPDSVPVAKYGAPRQQRERYVSPPDQQYSYVNTFYKLQDRRRASPPPPPEQSGLYCSKTTTTTRGRSSPRVRFSDEELSVLYPPSPSFQQNSRRMESTFLSQEPQEEADAFFDGGNSYANQYWTQRRENILRRVKK